MEDTSLPMCICSENSWGERFSRGAEGAGSGWVVPWTAPELSVFRPTSQSVILISRCGWIVQCNHGPEMFMTRSIAVERARTALRYAVVVCPTMMGRAKVGSPTQAHCWLVIAAQTPDCFWCVSLALPVWFSLCFSFLVALYWGSPRPSSSFMFVSREARIPTVTQ